MEAVSFLPAVLVPSQQELQLRTVRLAVAAFPSKAGSQLVRALGCVAPLAEHRHLKRVRKAPDDGSLLEAILCDLPQASLPDAGADRAPMPPAGSAGGAHLPAAGSGDVALDSAAAADVVSSSTSSGPTDLAVGCLPAALQSLFAEHRGVRLRLVHAAADAPQTRQQWEAWMPLWPITWRVPEHGAHVTEETAVDARTQAYFEGHMRLALRLAAQGAAANAAVIVQSAGSVPVAQAADGAAAHPLHHAVMLAIEAAAERDLRLWPGPAVGGSADAGSVSGDAEDGGQADGKEQRQQGSGQAQGPEGTAPGDDDGAAPSLGPGSIGCSGAMRIANSASASGDACAPEPLGGPGGGGGDDAADGLASKRPRLGEGPPDAAAASAGPRPYMCTGFDCFVVREPCVMCAMALVHSRVERVVYAVPDGAHGALGGCRRLHACRSLNHNYKVYRMEAKQGG
ncbi:tRNA-specific adenosine deaminase-like protein 3 [Tetrabaena socialis]|uniref:tRNA-specific adenosine deaminase-like protein 3 n=1 Tax=Tetrabaena socialis TaxID=47790 RepID=A0A2J8A6K5_9CHLO|nr:tRNA-specific adenosine deaminase-like protein 3 [Tetrabaena socialis]|eukprot:PNH08162.1 tRNA-specific adenosine deaminase-like protein 3 [Tetrabaena socialis]